MRNDESRQVNKELGTWIRDFRSIVLKRKWMILSVVFSTTISAFLFNSIKKPTYTARGTLWIDKEPNVLPVPDILDFEMGGAVYFQSQHKLLTSRTLASETIEKNKLYENSHFVGKLPGGQKPTLPLDSTLRERLIDKFIDRITIKPIRDTRIVEVGFRGHDPLFAADTLNAIFDAYVDLNIKRRYSVSEQATEFLTGQISAVRSEIEDLENKIQQYGAEKNIISLSATETTVINSLGEINRALAEATIARIEKFAHYNEIKSAPLANIPEARNNPLIQRLSEEYARLSREYARKLQVVKPEYPEMQQLKTELDAAHQALQNETRNLIRAAYADYQAALKNEQSLQEMFEMKKTDALQLNSNSILYNSLKIEIKNKNDLLESLLRRQGETDFSARLKELGSSNVWIVDKAAIPLKPSSPDKKLNLILAGLLGLTAGLGLALLVEHVNNVVRTSDDVAKSTGLSTLGFVLLLGTDSSQLSFKQKIGNILRISKGNEKGASANRSQAKNKIQADIQNHLDQMLPLEREGREWKSPIELISSKQPQSVQAENYRSIRTTLFVSSPPGKIKTLMITSPLTQEGKSSTVSNLAIAISQAKKRVVVVDSDLRKPRQHRIFGIPSREGLTNYLSSDVNFSDLIKPTKLANLYVIPAGPVPSNPIELMSSKKMDDLILYLKESFDYVLFDAPPVLVVSDAIALGPLIDAVILVTWEGKTPLVALRQAKLKLDVHRIKCLGVILNAIGVYERDIYYARRHYQYYR